MASRNLPGIGLAAFWGLGEDLYKDAMDGNWLKLSVLVQGTVLDVIDTLPGSPTNGDVYILDETASSEANTVAVRDEGAWIHYEPVAGWLMYDQTSEEHVRFNGTEWVVFNPSLPAFDIDDAGMVVGVNVDGTGYELISLSGLGGGGSAYEGATQFRIRTITEGSGGGSAWGTIAFSDVNGFAIPMDGTAAASTSEDDHLPYMAIDGDPATYWSFDIIEENANVSSWSITFDNPKIVGYLTVRPAIGWWILAPVEFAFEYYSDITEEWVLIGTFTTAWTTDDEQIFEASPPAVIGGGGTEGALIDTNNLSDVADVPTAQTNLKFIVLADQAAYDALDPVDEDAFYFIPEEV